MFIICNPVINIPVKQILSQHFSFGWTAEGLLSFTMLLLSRVLWFWLHWLAGQVWPVYAHRPRGKEAFLSSILMPMAVPTLGSVAECFPTSNSHATGWNSCTEKLLYLHCAALRGNKGYILWRGCQGNRRTEMFLAFMAGVCRGGHFEKRGHQGRGVAGFILPSHCKKKNGGGGSHSCEIFLRKLRRTSTKLTMG